MYTKLRPQMRLGGLALTLTSSLLAAQTQAQPFSGAASSPVAYVAARYQPQAACESLASLELFEVASMSARLLPAEGDVPAHCRVDGTIEPEVTFQVNLPLEWSGRFYMVGNGGPAGQNPETQAPARADALRNHFVMAATDTGHDSGREPGYTFVLSNPQKAIDYAYRAVHMTAATAKTISNAYYGRPVDYAYWNSCSNGGRQGLLEAQRYPDDFDGVIANAPWVDQTGFAIGAVWSQQAMDDVGMTAGKVNMLHEAVLAKCDALDGLTDGLIDNPVMCAMDVRRDVPQCAAGADGDACLTTAQSDAVQRVYDGPRTSSGEQLFPGFMPGSESSWMGLIVPASPDATAAVFGLGQGIMQYLAPLNPDPDWNYRDFDMDTAEAYVERWSRLADATDIDLREFRHGGGKLLITYGWADQVLQPMMGVNYYQQAVTANGPDGEDFMRLFMVPGMTHCAGGYGPDQHDPVTAIINWVEAGQAPDSLMASRVVDGETVRTRPLCPYPRVARYDGSGSIDEAENFRCEMP